MWTAPPGNPLEDLRAAIAAVEAAPGFMPDPFPAYDVATFRRMHAADQVTTDLLRAIDPTLPPGILDEDRHTRAMAQARAAGIDALRELRTSAA